MQKKFWIKLVMLIVIPGLLFTVSCTKNVKPVESTETPVAADDTAAEQAKADELARQRAEQLERQRAIEEENIRQEKARARAMFVNQDVYFDYNDVALKLEAQEVLRSKATWMTENPDVLVVIQGHCDDRGTTEYNLALGDKRANSVKGFLVDMGVNVSRLSTISYGEEQPAVSGADEASWSKNRRAHFVIE